jgi:hypothetical protein
MRARQEGHVANNRKIKNAYKNTTEIKNYVF